MGNIYPTYKTKEEYFQATVRKDSNQDSIFGGALGLGDPEDKYLYRKEIRFGLPAKRKEIILDEYCSKPHEDLLACQERKKILGKFRCRNENFERTQCLRQFWNLPGLEERTYNEYLAARSHFRQTGISQIKKKPKWMQQFTVQPKTWEEYSETKDDSPKLWEFIYNFWRKEKPPDESVPMDSEPLNDS